MAGQIFVPNGTTLTFDSQDVGGLVTIALPSETRGDVETTTNDSNFQRTYIPGLRDGGTISITCRLIPGDAGQAALRTNFGSNEVVSGIITLPDAATTDSTVTTYTFDCYVNALGGDLPQDADDTAMLTATLKVAGAVTEATA